MKKIMKFCAAAFMLMSCANEGMILPQQAFSPDETVGHGMIVLGDRLENPYTTVNVQRAFASVYPTKSRQEVKTTDLYVRFLPCNQREFDLLLDLGLELVDHPVDYEIVKEGDYYHDPSVGKEAITWQYAVVDKDFKFPDVRYEVIDECFLADNSPQSKAMDGVDWEAVEREAYILSGNERLLDESSSTKAAVKLCPSGRISIVDADANGGQPFGLAGVKVVCNSFIKFASTYTDRDGYYSMPKKFSTNPRYRLMFQNEKGFSLGVNLVLVPASVSALGKHSPAGLNYTITRDSEEKLFNRAVVNNAAYDYICRCSGEDMDIIAPPKDLRIWLFNKLSCSSAVMIHHGAIVDHGLLQKYLGVYASLIKFFAPDITIGTEGHDSYLELYDSVVHELSHASHFAQVGTDYWNCYIGHIVRTFLTGGGNTYGHGNESAAGYCEVGEMWAYYLESMMHKERYGGSVPAYGTSYWFFPQIFRYMENRGVPRSGIFEALKAHVISKAALQEELEKMYPSKQIMIEQVFNRYR